MDTSGYKNFKIFKEVYGNTALYKVIRDNMLEIIGVDDCKKWVYEKTHSVLHHKCLQCGKEFTFRQDKSRKFCSRRCYGIARSKGLKRKVYLNIQERQGLSEV